MIQYAAWESKYGQIAVEGVPEKGTEARRRTSIGLTAPSTDQGARVINSEPAADEPEAPELDAILDALLDHAVEQASTLLGQGRRGDGWAIRRAGSCGGVDPE